MSTKALTLTVPVSLAQELDLASQGFLAEILERGLHELKIERALERYARGGISFGAAAHHAGVSQSELARHAYAHGMEPPFSAETLAEELT
ncbi:MAG: antitoxin [bacterium]|nr:antitoxin [bacterium]